MKNLLRPVFLVGAALLTIGANQNWHAAVVKTDRSHQIGNPEAKVKLTEFVSYTCPHCASFAAKGEPVLQLAYIGQGTVQLEIRSIIRNDVDLTISLLVGCGDTDKFMRNHTYFMSTQDKWLKVFENSTLGQRLRWSSADGPTARRAIASDAGYYQMMETRGYTRTEIDRCLSDDKEAERLEANTLADFAEYKVRGTPSFAINGELLDHVHSWQALEPVLNANF
ncbi:DsbA family protein [Pontixanthobacter aquaemixtae]|uniref:Thioredoxin domain-containing protein n=1 Tax=Pontixanthobacter aquaemixtae TaxID=1958940 RepID=A0A844ZUR8_9SPHN|nr:thioredoxin domain-containing protein [Pontixanthobacter aquaemixtae]MXO90716.1 thioredoxin domain-containing protein [Pontixanthobacter aquaemixtae]